MPLDADTRALLKALEDQNIPPFSSMDPKECREFSEKAFATPPEMLIQTAHVENLLCPGPEGDIPLRVYSPDRGKQLPTLLHFHGGGWVIMSLNTHDNLCRSIVSQAECNVVSVDYRLAPEHKFPAALDDCYAALSWVSENAEKVGADPERLGVIGDSAGGNLAAAVSLRAAEENRPKLSVAVLTYPALDAQLSFPSMTENGEGYLLTKADMEYFYDHYLEEGTDRSDPYLSPFYAPNLEGLPPTLIVTAEFDPLRDEAEAFASRLKEAGVPTTLRRFPGTVHGFILFPHLIAKAIDAMALEVDFVKNTFAGI